METILVLLITFVAMFVQTIAGFGYGSIAVPCCSFIMSTSESTALTSTVALVSIIILAIINIKKANYKLLLCTVPTAIIGIILGTSVADSLPDRLLKRFLGIVLILSAIYQLYISRQIKVKKSMGLAISMGLLSGFLQGSIVMGGQPIALFLLSATNDKDEYLGTINWYFVIINIVTVTAKILNHSINMGNINLVGLMMIPTVAAIYLGTKVVKRLTLDNMKMIIYIFMIVVGSYISIFG